MTWVNVSEPGQLESAREQIRNLTVAHSDLGKNFDDGGTNIEGALMLAANVWESNATVMALDYKYTILLTDGQPTYHVNNNNYTETQKINGTAGGSNKTYFEDAKDVGVQAQRILKMKGVPKLYSICFGHGVWETQPFQNFSNKQMQDAEPDIDGKDMTVGDWLGAFSTRAFNGEASDLFAAFNSVISQIQLATQAWRVTDKMGDHVVYGDEVKQGNLKNSISPDPVVNELTWNILGSDHSDYEEREVGGKKYSILTYTYKYKITLDNLDNLTTDGTAAYTGGATPTNANAELTFAVKSDGANGDGLWHVAEKTAKFPVPEVQGYPCGH